MVYLYCQKVIGKQIRKIFLKKFHKILDKKNWKWYNTSIKNRRRKYNETKKNVQTDLRMDQIST